MKNPVISLVVVAFDIPREIERTLRSLSPDYQRHIDADDYEIVVVDNGSAEPIDADWIAGLSGNFRLIRIDDASPSPAAAINRGIAEARGGIVGVMIDGARIVTPGMLGFALRGARLHPRAVVATLGWYVGHDFQGRVGDRSSARRRDEALLAQIDWPNDGYRLFEIGTMDESSIDGWLQPIAESNAIFSARANWDALGGMDERFDLPGGGLVNLDTFNRFMELADAELVILLGEATFHQWHGGISTNASPGRQIENWATWTAQYAQIRGKAYETNRIGPPIYLGVLPPVALARFARAALRPAVRQAERPVGASFNEALWTSAIPPRADDEITARLIDLARDAFVHGRLEACCAIARLVRERAPDEPGIRSLLALVAPSVSLHGPVEERRAEYLVGLADAFAILGRSGEAETSYRAALRIERDLPAAHLGLAALRMPGDGYLLVLERLYRALEPETAVEIGIFQGSSLALFRPPTVAIGVDPNATLLAPLQTETHIYAETSDEFFARGRYAKLLGARPLGVGFIDGLHLFEQALKDFIGLEALCGPRSVVLMHDTVPLDDETQSRSRDTVFHTGDVWKVLACLKFYRPDLTFVTIGTPPTGLTLITGLDPTSRVLPDRLDEAIARFVDAPFSSIASVAGAALNIVPNDWAFVEAHLQERGVLR